MLSFPYLYLFCTIGFTILQSKPDISILNELVGSQIPAKWELFGVQVGLEQGCLDCLRSDFHDSKVRFIHLNGKGERHQTSLGLQLSKYYSRIQYVNIH